MRCYSRKLSYLYSTALYSHALAGLKKTKLECLSLRQCNTIVISSSIFSINFSAPKSTTTTPVLLRVLRTEIQRTWKEHIILTLLITTTITITADTEQPLRRTSLWRTIIWITVACTTRLARTNTSMDTTNNNHKTLTNITDTTRTGLVDS